MDRQAGPGVVSDEAEMSAAELEARHEADQKERARRAAIVARASRGSAMDRPASAGEAAEWKRRAAERLAATRAARQGGQDRAAGGDK